MPTDSPRTCPECGAKLPVGTGPGQCPNCLLGLGLAAAEGQSQKPEGEAERPETNRQRSSETPSLHPRSSTIGTTFGDYELLEEIGRGGMGLVYKARQKSLDRIVALKLLIFGPHAPPESVKRFRTEAVATAALQHPNIVAVHEVGFCEGQHFITMDYVEGQCLSALIRTDPLSARKAAGYLKAIAEAVHYAHERGILHRDLKPSNVLIDAQDQPRVTDFGLARRLEGDSELTVSGQVLGSPNYMPPEQATGKRGTASRRSDVYALGAILYHALTGRSPFVGEGLADTVQQVLTVDPVSPRVFNPRLPADLETVCLKCLEKEPAKRYATAHMVAEELGRFVEGKPVLARPVGRLAKSWRWCRRNPRLALTSGAAVLCLLLGLAGVTWQWRRAEAERARTERNLYAADINLAYHYLKDGHSSQALDLLGQYGPVGKSEIRNPKSEMDLRGWEWRYLCGQARSEVELVLDRMPSQCRLDLSADGRFLSVASRYGSLHLWDLTTRRLVAALGREFPANVTYASVSADGRWLAFLESSEVQPPRVVLWEVETQERRAELVGTNFAVLLPFAFVPSSPVVLVGREATFDRARSLALWNYEAGRIIGTYAWSQHVFPRSASLDFPFTADGSAFVCGEMDGRIRTFDSSTLELRSEFAAHGSAVSALALSPDGKTLATAQVDGNTSIQLWDFETFQPLSTLSGHAQCVTALAFSRNGRLLVSGSADHTIRVWDIVTRQEVRRLLGHKGEIVCVRASPNDQRLYSSGMDGLVCVWRLEGEPRRMRPEQWPLKVDAWSLCPDGRRLAFVDKAGLAGICDVASGEVLDRLPGQGNDNRDVLFAADGRLLFVAKRSGDLFVWDPPERRLVRELAEKVDVSWAEKSQNGGLVVALDESARIHAWHTDTWQGRVWEEVWQSEAASRIAPSPPLALSPDGQRLAIGLGGGIVRVMDPWTGKLLRVLKHGERATRRVAFSADGRLLAASSLDASVTVWETSSWRETVRLSLPHWADSLAFSPDGRLVALGSRAEEAVKLWDTATWRELLTLEAPGGYLWQLVFTPDGRRLLGSNEGGDLLIWSAPLWEEVAALEKRGQAP